MMAAVNDGLAASLGFMADAAHLLAQAAPKTSAHIMSQRNTLMFQNNLEQPDTHRQHVCGSCGHIMIPGQGSLIKLESEKMLRRNRKRNGKHINLPSKSSQTKRAKVLTCGNCERYTRINMPEPPSVSRNRVKLRQAARRTEDEARAEKTAAATSSATQLDTHTAPEPPKGQVSLSANASSKKRAKNRKQGLQALLQQSQASAPKVGLGLSLTDFMRK